MILGRLGCLNVLTGLEMCLISDHRNDLQYGSVLCHQEQQGGHIDGEFTHSLTPS